jgi:hypothetical protein
VLTIIINLILIGHDSRTIELAPVALRGAISYYATLNEENHHISM